MANTDLEGNFSGPAGVEEAEEVDAVPLGGDRFGEGYGGEVEGRDGEHTLLELEGEVTLRLDVDLNHGVPG